MKQSIEISSLSQPGDQEALTEILARCYGAPPQVWDPYFTRLGNENFRLARLGGEVAGGLAIYFMGQWFGGRSVPMAGIAAVGVGPERRGTGVAFELMVETLRELHQSGIPLSTLYPSTQRLYRKVGYERAGVRCQFAIETRSIGIEDRSLPLRPVDPERHEVFHDLYRRRAERDAGNLDRNSAIWGRMASPRDGEKAIYAYLAGEASRPEGYVVFTQPEKDSGYDLFVRDLVALTPEAVRSLLTFAGDHRSMAREMIWCGPQADPVASLFAEQNHRVKHLEWWMMRIVDVRKALAMRGYPGEVEAELHLDVSDDLLPANQGRIVLRVAEGRAEVTRGGRGELKLMVSGLGPLYSGFLSPQQLAAIGFLSGPPAALSTAARLFAGPEPWMPDYF